MAKRAHARRNSSSSPSPSRDGDEKRSKRDIADTATAFGEGKFLRPKHQRLYHGVCSDVSNRYRKTGDGRIGEGTYGVVYCARDTWKEQSNSSDGGGGVDGNERASTAIHKTEPNTMVALKKCYAHHEASDGFPITTLREIHALRVCSSHPNIVDLLEIAVSNGNSSRKSDGGDEGRSKANGPMTKKTKMKIGKSNVFLVFEHCRYDLAQILDSYNQHARNNNRRQGATRSSPFSLSQTKTLTIQLLSALKHCHSHGLIHRDIKPSNLLYDTITGRLKVCDFGLSRIAKDSHMTPNVVSLWYRSPELLLPASKEYSNRNNTSSDRRIRYSFPIDLWAVGCIVVELLEGQPFLTGSSEIEQLEKMEESLGPPPSWLYSVGEKRKHYKHRNDHTRIGLWDDFEHLQPEGLTLLARLLEYDPSERWTAIEALDAAFLSPASVPAPIKDLQAMPRGFPGC